jgi:hypothetical protein
VVAAVLVVAVVPCFGQHEHVTSITSCDAPYGHCTACLDCPNIVFMPVFSKLGGQRTLSEAARCFSQHEHVTSIVDERLTTTP